MTVVLVPEVANMCVHLCVCLYVCVRVCVHPASLHSKISYAMKLSFTFRLGKTALLPKNHDIQVYQLFGLEPFPQSIYIWHPFDKTEPPCEKTDIKQNNDYNVAIRMCGTRVDCMIFIPVYKDYKSEDKWFETWYGLLSSSGPGIGPITSPLYFFLEGIKTLFSQSAGLIYKTSLYEWTITLVSGWVGKNGFCNCALFSTESIV